MGIFSALFGGNKKKKTLYDYLLLSDAESVKASIIVILNDLKSIGIKFDIRKDQYGLMLIREMLASHFKKNPPADMDEFKKNLGGIYTSLFSPLTEADETAGAACVSLLTQTFIDRDLQDKADFITAHFRKMQEAGEIDHTKDAFHALRSCMAALEEHQGDAYFNELVMQEKSLRQPSDEISQNE